MCPFSLVFTADVPDPMRKREDFAVSLRKQKKEKIIQERRKRLMVSLNPDQRK